jgi:hypothetical protein
VRLFIVGKKLDEHLFAWEFAGVYDSIRAAEARCIDHNYFIGPVDLNSDIPEARQEWPQAYYPKAKA